MKTSIASALLILLSAGFVSAQKITVQGEKKLNVDFTKYKTFGLQQSETPGRQIVAYSYEEAQSSQPSVTTVTNSGYKPKEVVVYSYAYTIPSEDPKMNSAVVTALESEMQGRGYRKTDMSPDLLVAYKLFEHSTKIKGYSEQPTVVENTEVHQPQDTLTYKLKPGTVFVSLIDAKTGVVVWEGFASGVARDDGSIRDERKIREAINLIFKQFPFRGDKYSSNN